MNKHQKMIVSITNKEQKQNVLEHNFDMINATFRLRRICVRHVFGKDSIAFLSGYKKESYKLQENLKTSYKMKGE